jgi:hypothetical protein
MKWTKILFWRVNFQNKLCLQIKEMKILQTRKENANYSSNLKIINIV